MTLMLLDSASLWYRAYFGMPDSLMSPSGLPVNAIRGFLDMSSRLIVKYRPERLIACLEGDWRPSWRVKLFPGYKLNRIDETGEEVEPDTLSPQIPILLDVLEAFGIPILGVDDYEADDLIATFSSIKEGPIRIVTGDRDLFQLVNDDRDVKVVYLAKGVTNHELVDLHWIQKKYAIPGNRYGLFSMIRGDTSDGLPGIKGIGEKGASELTRIFSSLPEIVEAAQMDSDKLPKKYRQKILQSIEYARIAPKLVSCALDVPIPKMSVDLPKKPKNLSQIREMQETYGLGSSVDRFISALNWN